MQEIITSHLQNMSSSLRYFYPELLLTLTFLLVIIADLFFGKKSEKIAPSIGIIGVVVTSYLTLLQFTFSSAQQVPLFNSMIYFDNLAVVFKLIFVFTALIIFIFSMHDEQLKKNRKRLGEYFSILTGMLLGLNLMAMAGNLLMIYLTIEMVSICSYILAAYQAQNKPSAEAGMKYALFGAASSAVMLYGISLLYGLTGSLELFSGDFLAQLSKAEMIASSFAILLTLGGFLFKISAAPFHFWTPDVYQGAATPIVAFFSVAPKAAGFALLIRFLNVFTFRLDDLNLTWPNFDWETILAALAIITMTVGNLSAIAQTNLKRLLAYSSIAHTGFLLMGIAVLSDAGTVAVLFYFFIYALMNLGAFIIVGLISNLTGMEDIRDYKGIGMKLPLVSVCLVVFLVSLIGLPPTAGFIGKFLIFSAVWDVYSSGGNHWMLALLIVGVLNTVISLFYYFKIPLYMFFRKQEKELTFPKSYPALVAMVVLLALPVLYVGLFPSELAHFLQNKIVATSGIFFFQP